MSVPPRVRTERFCRTMASASEQRTSWEGMPLLMRLTMSVSAKTPHLAATWWSFESSKWRLVTISGGAFTLRKHLSMVAPVPDAHLSFMDAVAVFPPPFSSFLNMMIFASCPPSSMTEPTSGCRCSTDSVTAFTSWTNFPPVGAQMGAEPEPVRNIRHWPAATDTSGNAARIVSSIDITYSGCFV